MWRKRGHQEANQMDLAILSHASRLGSATNFGQFVNGSVITARI